MFVSRLLVARYDTSSLEQGPWKGQNSLTIFTSQGASHNWQMLGVTNWGCESRLHLNTIQLHNYKETLSANLDI
uniref:Uncharacterized protein n=1 Tax=Arundo donax TaxID=35708 RepID=A0A0A8XX91_ARUDO